MRFASTPLTPRLVGWAASLLLVLLLPTSSFGDPALPKSERVLSLARNAGYEEQLEQIPATVIDRGALAFVPYVSFRVGPDREINIYGDLDAPACIEFGLYRSLLSSEQEKRLCLALATVLMPTLPIPSVRLSGERLLTNGYVVEITTPDAPDAYGGWWISIYSPRQLDAARGSPTTVEKISESRESTGSNPEWSRTELTRARPVAPAPARPSDWASGSRSFSHRVYVRSYVRKDGVYVRSHSRRK